MEYMGTTIVQPFCCLQKKKKKNEDLSSPDSQLLEFIRSNHWWREKKNVTKTFH
jgi:hypothetical protein